MTGTFIYDTKIDFFSINAFNGYDQIMIAATGAVIDTTGTAIIINGSSKTINVLGTVFGGPTHSSLELGTDSTAHDNRLFIGETGYINGSANSAAVETLGYHALIENAGMIWNRNINGSGIRITGMDGSKTSTVNNSGTIDADSVGINILGNEKIHIENSGLIRADLAIRGASGALGIINTGQIVGDIQLSTADDIFDTRTGKLSGYVDGSTGNDIFYGSKGNDHFFGHVGEDRLSGYGGNDTLDGGKGNDNLWGGTGNDTINGGDDNDALYGEAGNDTIDGGNGNDNISGGLGQDRLNGGIEDDFLYGEAGNDTLTGGDGIDQIYGGAGNDTIDGSDGSHGSDGSDKIYGGLGVDKLTGGGNDDTFFFKANETGKTAATADTIYDFEKSEYNKGIRYGDLIDLDSIDANAKASGYQDFTFIGSQAFHGKAGELRFTKLASDTYIYADMNGDKKADFVIHLDDAITLVKDDFAL